jgi:hypothetical protein
VQEESGVAEKTVPLPDEDPQIAAELLLLAS